MGETESQAAPPAPTVASAAVAVAARTPWARIELAAAALMAVLVLILGAWVGHKLTPQPVKEDVAPAPQVVQADQSVIAQRAPDAHPPAPRHIIPKGYVEERREAIVVRPAPAASSVEIDLSLVRDGAQRRVIASSPDGQVVSALDIPIEPALMPPTPRPWAAGLAYGTDHAVGVWLERDLGRLRLGAEVAKGEGKPRAELRVGVAF